MLKVSRKGLYFKTDMIAGEMIKKSDIIARRPFNNLKVSDYKSIINKRLRKNVLKNQSINLKLLKKKKNKNLFF